MFLKGKNNKTIANIKTAHFMNFGNKIRAFIPIKLYHEARIKRGLIVDKFLSQFLPLV